MTFTGTASRLSKSIGSEHLTRSTAASFVSLLMAWGSPMPPPIPVLMVSSRAFNPSYRISASFTIPRLANASATNWSTASLSGSGTSRKIRFVCRRFQIFIKIDYQDFTLESKDNARPASPVIKHFPVIVKRRVLLAVAVNKGFPFSRPRARIFFPVPQVNRRPEFPVLPQRPGIMT